MAAAAGQDPWINQTFQYTGEPVSGAAGKRAEVGAIEVQVLKARPSLTNPGQKEYYITFSGVDKRHDKWIGNEQLQQLTARRARRQAVASQKRNSGSHAHSVHAHSHHDPKTKVRNIDVVQLGAHDIDCWYYSAYPGVFGEMVRKLYVCEFTFKYMLEKSTYERHKSSVTRRHPPGRQIYDDPNRKLGVFEIVGKQDRVYCQNLCLFAKLFIEHKTLFYDPDAFLFYVLTEYDDDNTHHPVGYFSKEILSKEGYNLACILTFPQFQRKGYGKFLMSLSYEISKREGKLGSPEKPLSDLGKHSYLSYWQYVLLRLLNKWSPQKDKASQLSVKSISEQTGFTVNDIIVTMEYMGLLSEWRQQTVFLFTPADIETKLQKFVQRDYGSKLCLPQYLTWREYPAGVLESVMEQDEKEASAASEGTASASNGGESSSPSSADPSQPAPAKRARLTESNSSES